MDHTQHTLERLLNPSNAPLALPLLLDCGHPESPHGAHTRGYGIDSEGHKHCYACCADSDRAQMRESGDICLYLVKDASGHAVTNWPGSLRIPVGNVRRGRHNIATYQYHFWFVFDGFVWHGVQYGDNTQLARCRRTKERA